MSRYLLLVPLVALVAAVPAEAKRAPAPAPVIRALRADVVFVGTVTALEKETIDAAEYPGADTKVAHKVAVVRVKTPLGGLGDTTHVKIGCVLPPADVPRRSGPAPFAATEGMEALFFLTKHHAADFYTVTWVTTPVDAKDATFEAEVGRATRALAAVADPLKALKADKQTDRFFAATALVAKYRSHPENADEVAAEKVPAEVSNLVLKALAEHKDWTDAAGVSTGTQALFMLGMTGADGWNQPVPKPGVPADINGMFRDAFIAWLAGPGKNYQVNRLVAKKK